MDLLFVVEDERHAEQVARYPSRRQAVAELRRLAGLPWDSPENVAPCTGWKTCGRVYELVTYDSAAHPWREVNREEVVEVRESGTRWKVDPATFE